MLDFKRRRGESSSAWCVRLSAADMAALTPRQLDELTFRRVLADRALRRENRSRLRKDAAETEGPDGAESGDLRRCKDVIGLLSSEDRRRLMEWVEALPGGAVS